MTNQLFAKGREGFLAGDIDWDGNDIRLVCVDHADDTPVPATDDNLDDIGAAARVAVSGAFAGKTVTDGVADADDVTLTAVTGDPFESFLVYKHTGTESTARLIAFWDTVTGLPLTPSGTDIIFQWDSGANRMFKL